MTTSLEPEPERTERSTQELPKIFTVQEIKTWDTEELLLWIQGKDPNILKGHDLDDFRKAGIIGRTFLGSSAEDFGKFGLSWRVSLGLKFLANEVKEEDEVKEGKFIPRT